MGQRITRVNELVKREISNIIHTHLRDEAVNITITDVDVAPDLRNARIYFSVFGDNIKLRQAISLLSKNKKEIKHLLGKVVTLKYLPHLEFIVDPSIKKGVELIEYMDEVDADNHQDNEDEND